MVLAPQPKDAELNHVLPARDTPHTRRDTHIESESMDNAAPCSWSLEASRSSSHFQTQQNSSQKWAEQTKMVSNSHRCRDRREEIQGRTEQNSNHKEASSFFVEVWSHSLVKGTIQQKEITIALKVDTSNFIKQKLLDIKGRTDTSAINHTEGI